MAGTGATNSSEPAKQPAEAWARLRVRELERQIRSLQRAAEAQASGAALGAREATEAEADGKVVRGRDGWLYLAHDTNRVLDQITGDLLLSQDDLDGWEEVLEDRFESATEAGAAYALIVPPNQHAVYPEHLPAGIELSEQRPVRQLLERVGGSDPPFIYPLEQLIEGKKERPTYAPVDTHWTDWGAFIGYEALCDALEAQGVELRRLSEDDLEWSEAEIEGDLGSKVSPPERATEWRARIREPSSRLLFDNRIRNRGRELIYETDAAPSKLLVFGESFGYVAIKYLSETFGRVVYAHLSGSFDESLVDREQPDAIATIINERFLIQVPDGFGPTIEEVRKRKGLMNEESARRHKALALRGHVVEELDEPEE